MSNMICGKDIMTDVRAAASLCTFKVTDTNVAALYPDITAGAFVIEAGEKSKNVDTLNAILGAMHEAGVKRTDTVAAIGGGVVGDITGLATALYMRGVDWVSIPTTLLAMVDSGIGGKTAVDFAGVKNLVGAFHFPRDIIINAGFLKTLPEREWVCGDGELIKTCLLSKSGFELLNKHMAAVFDNDPEGIYPLIKACVDTKSAVVAADPTEKGLRRILNVGHTVGHALESIDGYKISHGEYVLKGMMTEAAMCKDLINPDFYAGLIRFLGRFTRPPRTTAKAVLDLAVSDKKNRGNTITIMLPVNAGEIIDVRLEHDDFISRYNEALKELKDA